VQAALAASHFQVHGGRRAPRASSAPPGFSDPSARVPEARKTAATFAAATTALLGPWSGVIWLRREVGRRSDCHQGGHWYFEVGANTACGLRGYCFYWLLQETGPANELPGNVATRSVACARRKSRVSGRSTKSMASAKWVRSSACRTQHCTLLAVLWYGEARASAIRRYVVEVFGASVNYKLHGATSGCCYPTWR